VQAAARAKARRALLADLATHDAEITAAISASHRSKNAAPEPGAPKNTDDGHKESTDDGTEDSAGDS